MYNSNYWTTKNFELTRSPGDPSDTLATGYLVVKTYNDQICADAMDTFYHIFVTL